eukprot:TRINITY_DN12090_c0_g2_i7.p1 TRINITY_DN12090_c0_g2~~TRINITY_DN12090_c0_g2_i7.p1  ORF type:complete len:272 (-),score=48.42 TRINITY_DN12090_c0_g2_i7:149-964(-)
MWASTWFVIIDQEFVTSAKLIYAVFCGTCTIILLFTKTIMLKLDAIQELRAFDEAEKNHPGCTVEFEEKEPFSLSSRTPVLIPDPSTIVRTTRQSKHDDFFVMEDATEITIEANELRRPTPTIDAPLFEQLEARKRERHDARFTTRNRDFFRSLDPRSRDERQGEPAPDEVVDVDSRFKSEMTEFTTCNETEPLSPKPSKPRRELKMQGQTRRTVRSSEGLVGSGFNRPTDMMDVLYRDEPSTHSRTERSAASARSGRSRSLSLQSEVVHL